MPRFVHTNMVEQRGGGSCNVVQLSLKPPHILCSKKNSPKKMVCKLNLVLRNKTQ